MALGTIERAEADGGQTVSVFNKKKEKRNRDQERAQVDPQQDRIRGLTCRLMSPSAVSGLTV